MFHCPALFVSCCEFSVKVLLVAANHRINRAFPAVWWAKHSFGRGWRQVPEQSRRWSWEGEALEQSSHSILTGERRLPSITEAELAAAHRCGEKEGCSAQLLPGSEQGRGPQVQSWAVIPACAKTAPWSSCSHSRLPVARLQKSVLLALSSSTTGKQTPYSSWVFLSSWISHLRNALNCKGGDFCIT